MSIGQRIKRARESKGLTQQALADALGVEPPTISRWETDVHVPGARQWPRICKTLGRDLEWFQGAPAYIPPASQDVIPARSHPTHDEIGIAALVDRVVKLERELQALRSGDQHLSEIESERRIREAVEAFKGKYREIISVWDAAGPELRVIGLLAMTADPRYLERLSPQNQKVWAAYLKAGRSRPRSGR